MIVDPGQRRRGHGQGPDGRLGVRPSADASNGKRQIGTAAELSLQAWPEGLGDLRSPV
jgi:hypothetical protein